MNEPITSLRIDIYLSDVIAAAAYDLLDGAEDGLPPDDSDVVEWAQSRTAADLLASVRAQIISNLERDRENARDSYVGASGWDFMADEVETQWDREKHTLVPPITADELDTASTYLGSEADRLHENANEYPDEETDSEEYGELAARLSAVARTIQAGTA